MCAFKKKQTWRAFVWPSFGHSHGNLSGDIECCLKLFTIMPPLYLFVCHRVLELISGLDDGLDVQFPSLSGSGTSACVVLKQRQGALLLCRSMKLWSGCTRQTNICFPVKTGAISACAAPLWDVHLTTDVSVMGPDTGAAGVNWGLVSHAGLHQLWRDRPAMKIHFHKEKMKKADISLNQI